MNRRRRNQSGFTLLELMTIITIILVTAALAMPAVRSAMAERQAGDASRELVLLARQGRSQAAAFGRAFLLRWTNGTFTLYRGLSSSCAGNDWQTTIVPASNCGAANPVNCVDDLNPADFTIGSTTVDVQNAGGLGALDICWEPNGRTLWRNAATNPFTSANTVGGGFGFVFQRQTSGSDQGVARTVIIPLGADARELR